MENYDLVNKLTHMIFALINYICDFFNFLSIF